MNSTKQEQPQQPSASTAAHSTDIPSRESSRAAHADATGGRCGKVASCSALGTSSSKSLTMKAKIIYTLYGLGFLAFIGFGWSLAEDPTFGKGIITAGCFAALYLGARIVNKVA